MARRLHRRRRRRRPLARARAGQGSLARHMVRIEGPIARLMEGAFNENFIETARAGRARSSIRRGSPPTPQDSAMVAAQLADRRQQRSEAAVPAGDRRRAPDRSTSLAVFHHRRVQRRGRCRGAPGAASNPRARRRGSDRRQAGEVPPAATPTSAPRARASRSTSTSRR